MNKPKRNSVGDYQFICANINCGRTFFSKNIRAITCCQQCRNEKNHLERKHKYGKQMEYCKSILLNTKILLALEKKECLEPLEQTLRVLGFNFEAGPIPEASPDGKGEIYFYGEIGIYEFPKYKYRIVRK
jgi:hypothetical protein